MVKIIEISLLAVYEKRNQKEYFAKEIGNELKYRNGTPCDEFSRNVMETFNLENRESVIFPTLTTKFLLVEPFKGRKCNNGDVHLSVLTKENNKDFRWNQIKSKDIIEMSYDESILMVTTFKRSRKIYYIFFLDRSLNDLSEFWERKYHPRKFLFGDFAKREHLNFNMDNLRSRNIQPSTSYEECLKLYILFVQENPSVTPDSFKQMLSEPGGMRKIIGFNPSAHEHILKWGRYRCFTCGKWCEMKCPCRVVRYCDIECQKSDWIHHQKECEVFSKCFDEANKISACFENYLQDKMKTSIDLTVRKFNRRLRRKAMHDNFNSRAIEYFPDETSKKSQYFDDVD